MTKRYVLILCCQDDFVKATLVNKSFRITAEVIHPISIQEVEPGLFECDALEVIYAIRSAITKLSKTSPLQQQNLDSISILTPGNQVVAWDMGSGNPISGVMTSHSRVNKLVYAQLIKDGMVSSIRDISGLNPQLNSGGLKWQVLHDRFSQEKLNHSRGDIMYGTLDSWIIYNLTGRKQFSTDVSSAQMSLLYDIKKGEWSVPLKKYFGLSRVHLPQVHHSSSDFGWTDGFVTLPDGVPIMGVSCYQQSVFTAYRLLKYKDTLLRMNPQGCRLFVNEGVDYKASSDDSQEWILSTFDGDVRYVYEKDVWLPAAIQDWSKISLKDYFKEISDSFSSQSILSVGSLQLTPSKQDDFKQDSLFSTTIRGLTSEQSSDDLFNAYLQAMLFSVLRTIEGLGEGPGLQVSDVHVEGDLFYFDSFCQVQSSVLQLPVMCCQFQSAIVQGGALLAGLRSGFFSKEFGLVKSRPIQRQFIPDLDPISLYTAYKKWLAGVEDELPKQPDEERVFQAPWTL